MTQRARRAARWSGARPKGDALQSPEEAVAPPRTPLFRSSWRKAGPNSECRDACGRAECAPLSPVLARIQVRGSRPPGIVAHVTCTPFPPVSFAVSVAALHCRAAGSAQRDALDAAVDAP
eukprot:363520-Chlamydomonas_euryale.AAC.4